VDWLGSKLSIRHGIVAQIVDDVKTEGSAKAFSLADDLLSRLKTWKQASRFSATGDWVFASPVSIGRLPYSTRALDGYSGAHPRPLDLITSQRTLSAIPTVHGWTQRELPSLSSKN
jgi:hypothetical protein